MRGRRDGGRESHSERRILGDRPAHISRQSKYRLLKRTRHARKGIIRIGADQPNSANHQHQDDGQHHCVFGNILPFVFTPQPAPVLFMKLSLLCFRFSVYVSSRGVHLNWRKLRFAEAGIIYYIEILRATVRDVGDEHHANNRSSSRHEIASPNFCSIHSVSQWIN